MNLWSCWQSKRSNFSRATFMTTIDSIFVWYSCCVTVIVAGYTTEWKLVVHVVLFLICVNLILHQREHGNKYHSWYWFGNFKFFFVQSRFPCLNSLKMSGDINWNKTSTSCSHIKTFIPIYYNRCQCFIIFCFTFVFRLCAYTAS